MRRLNAKILTFCTLPFALRIVGFKIFILMLPFDFEKPTANPSYYRYTTTMRIFQKIAERKETLINCLPIKRNQNIQNFFA